MKPVRAQLVEHPDQYPWSSYHANGLGSETSIVSQHAAYLELGGTVEERQSAYRELLRYDLRPGIIAEIRKSTNGNFAIGSRRFREKMSKALGRRLFPGKPGRPPKDIN